MLLLANEIQDMSTLKWQTWHWENERQWRKALRILWYEWTDNNRNVVSRHRGIHKATLVSPDGKTRNQIDHVPINKKFRNSVIDTRVRSADIGSDHHVVWTKVKLRTGKQQPKEQESIRARYDTNKLKEKNVLVTFMITLQNRYQVTGWRGGRRDRKGVSYNGRSIHDDSIWSIWPS